jgi:hypothetical protein
MTRSKRGPAVDPGFRDGRPVTDPFAESNYTLEELLKSVSKKNIHAEIGTGPSVGREQW